MKVIGITGGVGSGKSRVLYELEEKYGAYVVEADKLAHELMLPGMTIYDEIIKQFGTQILNEDETINRKKLGEIVFEDKNKLMALNAIVHPLVKISILDLIRKKKDEGSVKFFIIEAALLIQDGYKSICDEIWYIYVPLDVRIRRLKIQRGYSDEKCMEIVKNQPEDEFYIKNSDYVIDNSKSFDNVSEELYRLLY